MSNFITEVDTLLSQKRFFWLRKLVSEVRRVSSERNCPTELQVRYNSRVNIATESNERNFKYIFGYNKRSWKKLSGKQRSLLYFTAVLSRISDFERDSLENLLRKELGDAELRERISQAHTAEGLHSALLQLDSLEIRNLARFCSDLFRLIENSEEISFESLFTIQVFRINSPRPRKQVRHKGYRDHGSLGQSSVGLTHNQLRDYIVSESERNFYEEEGYLPSDIIGFFESPLLFKNPWRTY